MPRRRRLIGLIAALMLLASASVTVATASAAGAVRYTPYDCNLSEHPDLRILDVLVNDGYRGCVRFHPMNYSVAEMLSACDESRDGRYIHGKVKWFTKSGEQRIRTVTDRTVDGDCARTSTFNVPHNHRIWMRACIEGLGCSQWVRAGRVG